MAEIDMSVIANSIFLNAIVLALAAAGSPLSDMELVTAEGWGGAATRPSTFKKNRNVITVFHYCC